MSNNFQLNNPGSFKAIMLFATCLVIVIQLLK